ASDNVSVAQSVLSYSTNGGASYTPIVTLAGSPGTYAWTVPNTPTTQGLVRVVCSDPSGNAGSDVSNAFFTITNTPGPYIWVSNIALQLVTKGRNTNARATVTVRDQNNNPAGSATVSSAWSGLTTDTDVFTTAANGTGSCNSDKLRNATGCWTYTVQNVAKSGYTFRNDLGVLTGIICTPAGAAQRALSASVVGAPADSRREFQLSVPSAQHVTFTIYNVMGRRVRTLADGSLPEGVQTLIWDLKDDRGVPLPSGVYLYRAVAGDDVVTRKVVLVR
ncbi:MAG: FlgD immunoglobulin-like domain containing protein, partial [bacterium]